MTEVIVACVKTGTDCPFDHVRKFRDAVMRHMGGGYTIVCLTDQPERCEGVTFVDVTELGLPGRWATMVLFEPLWRERRKIIYIDLDTTVVGDITPLGDVPGEFAIRDDASVMVIGGGMASFVWHDFTRNCARTMRKHEQGGVRSCIEELYPNAPSLARLLPKGFFREAGIGIASR